MPTHVALLRGVNVCGGNKLPMADLRAIVTSLGHAEVSTYIQSGNVLFTPSDDDPAALAAELRAAISAALGLDPAVIVLSREELADIARANPYPDEPKPQYVHFVFLPGLPSDEASRRVSEIEQSLAGKSRDELTIIGRTLYLHTPDGFGDSELSKALLAKKNSPIAGGTARNLATVTKLLALSG
jgi:uncharacterized protein (DUF1697 family)